VAGLKRKNRELARELTHLRNMTVRDLDPESIANATGDELRPGR